jgi:hypothetical protein
MRILGNHRGRGNVELTMVWRAHRLGEGALSLRRIMLGGHFILGFKKTSMKLVHPCIVECSMWGCLLGYLYVSSLSVSISIYIYIYIYRAFVILEHLCTLFYLCNCLGEVL